MEEVYWIAGSELHYPPEEMTPEMHVQKGALVAESALAAARIRPVWVDEVHWLSDLDLPGVPRAALTEAGLSAEKPLLEWGSIPILDHMLLQSAALAILAEDNHLVFLGRQVGCATSALLLASPTAVGRYNLNPVARLLGRLTLRINPKDSAETLKTIFRQLERKELDPSRISWIALSEGLSSWDTSPLPGVSLISVAACCPVGAFYQANTLIRTLAETGSACGLLISASQDGVLIGSLFERI